MTTKAKYNIGDSVWYAGRRHTYERVICPECFGKKYLTVILGDDSQVTIDCAGCSCGMEPPTGYKNLSVYLIDVFLVIIDRLEIATNEVRYTFNNHYISEEENLFTTKEEAEIRAKELVKQDNEEQLKNFYRKEKHNRDWSWHVHYYRDLIRNAEKTIERSKKKLDVAKLKAKVKDGEIND